MSASPANPLFPRLVVHSTKALPAALLEKPVSKKLANPVAPVSGRPEPIRIVLKPVPKISETFSANTGVFIFPTPKRNPPFV